MDQERRTSSDVSFSKALDGMEKYLPDCVALANSLDVDSWSAAKALFVSNLVVGMMTYSVQSEAMFFAYKRRQDVNGTNGQARNNQEPFGA